MKLRTDDLRSAVDAAIMYGREQWERDEQARHDEHDVNRKQWVTKNKAAWSAACTDIREALRRGKPITRDMLPHAERGYGDLVLTFDVPEPTPRTYRGPDPALIRIKTALRLITDAEVSTTALQQLGVSPSVLRDVLDLMPPPEVIP